MNLYYILIIITQLLLGRILLSWLRISDCSVFKLDCINNTFRLPKTENYIINRYLLSFSRLGLIKFYSLHAVIVAPLAYHVDLLTTLIYSI
jgi:hypothetical protein